MNYQSPLQPQIASARRLFLGAVVAAFVIGATHTVAFGAPSRPAAHHVATLAPDSALAIEQRIVQAHFFRSDAILREPNTSAASVMSERLALSSPVTEATSLLRPLGVQETAGQFAQNRIGTDAAGAGKTPAALSRADCLPAVGAFLIFLVVMAGVVSADRKREGRIR